jgi:hypothetical protein
VAQLGAAEADAAQLGAAQVRAQLLIQKYKISFPVIV